MAYRGSKVPGYTQGPVMGHESLEDQNEQMESDMKDKVSRLHQLSINIFVLPGLSKDFSKATLGLLYASRYYFS